MFCPDTSRLFKAEIAAVLTAFFFVGTVPVIAQSSHAVSEEHVKSQAELTADELRNARSAVKSTPTDAQKHFHLAELLRKSGRINEACTEYAEATKLNPEMFVAYHQLATSSTDVQILDAAVDRLNKLKETKPKELMLRVALSEVLEKQKQYYQAARTLIDMQYESGIPDKYKTRINARIHYLLARSKEHQLLSEKHPVPNDEELDVVPAPLPEPGLRRGLTASKIKESKELKGMGRVPLLP